MEDYCLILGMPGTGKTTTIAHIIRALSLLGKRVLVTAFTHSAIDNVFLKLKDIGVDFIRIGAKENITEDIRSYVIDRKTPQEQICKRFAEVNVVGCTGLGINSQLLNAFSQKDKDEPPFDICIVDEASQLITPVCMGPIMLAKKFVLVGDHYQLKPLLKSKNGKLFGLDKSLFEVLATEHPEAVATLSHQYRMNKEIMDLSNFITYDGRMTCDPWLETNFLEIDLSGVRKQWVRDVLDPRKPLLFLDTDAIPGLETVKGGEGRRVSNLVEIRIVRQLVTTLLDCGTPSTEVGVITPYVKQSKKIELALHHRGVEVSTVDKYQGREKSCIIISMVRSNEQHRIGRLLKDVRRINVALTRAKNKLIIIGSQSTLRASQPSEGSQLFVKSDEDKTLFEKLFSFCEQHGDIYTIPRSGGEELQ